MKSKISGFDIRISFNFCWIDPGHESCLLMSMRLGWRSAVHLSDGYSIPTVCKPVIRSATSTKYLYCFAAVFPTAYALKDVSGDSMSNLLGVALARCNAAGLAHLLPDTLPNIVFGKYESLGRSAPWYRHHNTVVLKQICATLRVRTFCGLSLAWTDPMSFRGWVALVSVNQILTPNYKYFGTLSDGKSRLSVSPDQRYGTSTRHDLLYFTYLPCSLHARTTVLEQVRDVENLYLIMTGSNTFGTVLLCLIQPQGFASSQSWFRTLSTALRC